MSEAVAGVIEAIFNQGPRPDLHCQILDRHRREWPSLWAALDRLVEEAGHPERIPRWD